MRISGAGVCVGAAALLIAGCGDPSSPGSATPEPPAAPSAPAAPAAPLPPPMQVTVRQFLDGEADPVVNACVSAGEEVQRLRGQSGANSARAAARAAQAACRPLILTLDSMQIDRSDPLEGRIRDQCSAGWSTLDGYFAAIAEPDRSFNLSLGGDAHDRARERARRRTARGSDADLDRRFQQHVEYMNACDAAAQQYDARRPR